MITTNALKRLCLCLVGITLGVCSLQAGTIFTFTAAFADISNGVGATGILDATDNLDGAFTAISGSGFYNGDSITLISNPLAPEAAYSPSGYFIYDDQLLPTQNPLLTNGGLLFLTSLGQELNIFSNGPSSYTTYLNNGFNAASNFELTEAASTPEPATLMLSASALILLLFGAERCCLRSRNVKDEVRKVFRSGASPMARPQL